jgi:hypothetical protein
MDIEFQRLATRVRRCEKMLSALLAHHGINVDAVNNPPDSVALKSTQQTETTVTNGRRWWPKNKSRLQAHGEVVG